MAIVAAMDSGFDYFRPRTVQNSIKTSDTVEYSPISVVQAGAAIEFCVTGGSAQSKYIALSQSNFKFRVKATMADGSAPQAVNEVTCVQNLAHSMWKSVQVFLGNTEIGDSNANYPYEAYLTNYLSTSKDMQDYIMFQEGWWGRDTPAQLDHFRTSDNNVQNAVQVIRNGIIGTGAEFELIMRPTKPIFHIPLNIPPGVQVRIRFTPAPHPFMIKHGAGTDANRLEILDAKFNCMLLEATGSQDLAVKEGVRTIDNLRFFMKRNTLKTFSIAGGKTTAEYDNVYLGKIPNRVIFGMVLNTSYAGSYVSSPFNFQHFNVNEVCLKVDGRNIPNEPYHPDFANRRYIREYSGLTAGMGKSSDPIAIPITYQEFGAGSTLFAFDLTADKNSDRSYSPQGTGSIRLGLKFAQPLANPITVILFAEYDDTLEIDQYCNVSQGSAV